MMSPADIARAHQFRDGWQLVDYCEVGLPVFRLTLEAVTLAQRSMPTIQEFTMKCLSLGETSEENIARMLGLRAEVIGGAINALVSNGYASRIPNVGQESAFKLTEAGEARLAKDHDDVPQEEMLVIDYDGTRRIPIKLTGESVVRAGHLKDAGAVEIRPYPAEPPAIDSLALMEVAKMIRRKANEGFRRTVLALKRTVRRNNLFREAVALVYASDKSTEVQVAFVIDGKLSDAHERAFAENGGPRKMGFVKAVVASDSRRSLQKLVGTTMMRRLPGHAELTAIRKEERDAHAEEAMLRSMAEAKTGRIRHTDPAVIAHEASKERLQVAKRALHSLEAYPLACFDMDELMGEALGSARARLLITSAGLQPAILTPHVLRAIDALAASRTRVEIDVFQALSGAARGQHFDPMAELFKRSERGSLKLSKRDPEDFFFLVQDDELAVVSSRPFFGDTTRRTGFSRVEGIVTRRAELVEEIRQLALAGRERKRRAR